MSNTRDLELDTKRQLAYWLQAEIKRMDREREELHRAAPNSDIKRFKTALTDMDDVSVLRQKIAELGVISDADRPSCMSALYQQFKRSLYRAPLLVIGGVSLMTVAFGYIGNTGASKYSGFEHDGDFVRIVIPTLFAVTGFLVFLWGFCYGGSGRCGSIARCECCCERREATYR